MTKKTIRVIKLSIEHTNIKVKIEHSTSDGVHVTIRLRQGNALSSIVFNIALEKIIREIGIGTKSVRLEETIIGLLAYVDNIVLMAEK